VQNVHGHYLLTSAEGLSVIKAPKEGVFMRALAVLLCLGISFQSFAEMLSKSRMKEIAQNAETFKKDCVAFSAEKTIQLDTVKNFTSEHLDSKDFGKLLGRELKLKNKKHTNQTAVVQAILRSKVLEQNQQRTTTYTLELMLKKGPQELCQQKYVSEFVARLAAQVQ
jgi:hypothetical protein